MDCEINLNSPQCPFLEKQKVDLRFKNIIYEVRKMRWKKPFTETKQILHGVSGELLSGELTAIMGPSGAGKSTLLNILAGYKVRGVKGSIYVNSQERNDPEAFKSLSSYILQDDHLRECLTVHEAMTMASELKLGRKVSAKQKQAQIKELLEMLRLSHCLKTPTGMLSGGQKKRLSLAFELITSPPVIFLDEPTTGLDSSSCSQCISILKMLAKQGRTIVCTIHQPSAFIFEMFTKVYALANGHCIYEGPTSELVPYLSEKGLKCPVYHNPADFLLEVAVGEYGPVLDRLIIKSNDSLNVPPVEEKAGKNGKFHLRNLKISDIKHCIKHQTTKDDSTVRPLKSKSDGLKSQIGNFWPTNFIFQFYCLYTTNIIIFQKAYKYRLVQFFAHFLAATLLGCTFQGTGNEASMVKSNITFVFAVLLFLMFTGKMSVTTTIYNELKVLKVQHFNRWYNLLPYYLSLIIIEIPMQMISCVFGIAVLYYLSNQPNDIFRFTYFQIFCVSTTLVAQAIGIFLGSWAPIKVAVFLGPITGAACSAYGFTVKLYDRSFFVQWGSFLSYFRSSFYSIMTVLYGFDRKHLDCEELYCHFKAPVKVLDELGIHNINIYSNLIYMCSLFVLMHILTFTVLYIKLNKR